MSDTDPNIEQRISRIEAALSTLAARVDALGAQNASHPYSGAFRSDPSRDESRPSLYPPRSEPVSGDSARVPFMRGKKKQAPWFTAKSAEWWLGRLGILFLSLALIFLYQYAVDRNWITPVVRVITGIVVGAGLLYAGSRMSRRKTVEATDEPNVEPDDVGLRELMLGGGLAAWYITAYAAAAMYQLIPISSARVIYLALSLAAAWMGLRESRAIFGIVAIVAGFAAPFLLRGESESIVAFALYIAALTAVGLLLYLMRGWQSVLWTTFLGTWITGGAASNDTISRYSITMTIVLIAVTAAFVRVPTLRRRLLETGSPRYTPAGRSRFSDWVFRVTNAFAAGIGGRVPLPDSPALWIVTLLSPILMVWGIANIWPTVSTTVWGFALVVAGLIAYRIRGIGATRDVEVEHVWVTGSALWTLFGVLWIADGAGPALRISSDSLMIGLASLHAAILLQLEAAQRYGAPRKLAYITVGLCLLAVLAEETSSMYVRAIPWSRTIAELAVLGATAVVWMRLRSDEKSRMVGVLFGLGAYIALLLIVNRVLGAVWQPLVTTTYAIAGAALLIASKRVADGSVLRKLGGLTMLLVVFRLFLIDLADVETIWRVLLFMLCGLLFLYTSYRLQPDKAVPPA